jgi:hypothetical protein
MAAAAVSGEVNVIMAVHILEMRAVGFGDEDGKFAGPFFHPIHGHAAEERFLGAGVESSGEGAFGDEFFFLAGHQSLEAGAVHGAVRRFLWRGHLWLRGSKEYSKAGGRSQRFLDWTMLAATVLPLHFFGREKSFLQLLGQRNSVESLHSCAPGAKFFFRRNVMLEKRDDFGSD